MDIANKDKICKFLMEVVESGKFLTFFKDKFKNFKTLRPRLYCF